MNLKNHGIFEDLFVDVTEVSVCMPNIHTGSYVVYVNMLLWQHFKHMNLLWNTYDIPECTFTSDMNLCTCGVCVYV